MINGGATHIGVATDHVIESFRNNLWPGYKTGEGIEPALWEQFPLLEEALTALGVAVWPMVEFEADDALASASAIAARSSEVERVLICTPDKDLAQCVRGTRVVQMIRRTRTIRDEAGVIEKFGVRPESIPDYLALVGDAADGFPGLPGWGAKSSAAVLAKYLHLEGDSIRRHNLGRERRARRRPEPDAGARTRARVPVPRPRDASDRRGAVSIQSRICVGRVRARRSRRSVPASMRLFRAGCSAGLPACLSRRT